MSEWQDDLNELDTPEQPPELPPEPAPAETAPPAPETAPRSLSRVPHWLAVIAVVAIVAQKIWKNYVFRLGFVLFSITTCSALLLGLVYNVTKPTIDALRDEATRAACAAVMPADEFILAELPAGSGVDNLYLARTGGRLVGYAAEAQASGYGGPIRLIVGVDLQGFVTGVEIVEMSETPGLGTKAQEGGWLDQFIGQSAGLKLGQDVDAISGSTITSRAVTQGVDAAVSAVLNFQQGGVTP
jgi:electron transport complex protein RnfG